MGWEERRGRKYYYRKRRNGGRVVSEYVGRGQLAEAVAAQDESKRLAQDQPRELLRQEQEKQRAIDQEVDRVCRLIQNLTYGTLLVHGFHTHKGQWRKRR